MKYFNVKRVLEFIFAGLVLDLAENLIVIKAATDAPLTFDVVKVAFMVVIPFAIITELIIDHPNFWHRVFSFFKRSRR
ncbi:MAG: hypothetical protein Q8P35_03110 [Candidatus Yanofskybacteria bacterium]|nr:hypothetical protein [Candidatus Yanofskybacteria bacterium]